MERAVDVAIIGAGQAGLATSWHLSQAGIDHVVLDSGRVAETWRSRRWDSFRLITPNWAIELPGIAYSGHEPDGYMSRAELIGFFESWVASFKPPLQGNTHVSQLTADPDGGFVLTVGDGKIHARKVVVASGVIRRRTGRGVRTLSPRRCTRCCPRTTGTPTRCRPETC
jgi:putative flavoprotein involved in K+ transport